jgi:hypothetical protein
VAVRSQPTWYLYERTFNSYVDGRFCRWDDKSSWTVNDDGVLSAVNEGPKPTPGASNWRSGAYKDNFLRLIAIVRHPSWLDISPRALIERNERDGRTDALI